MEEDLSLWFSEERRGDGVSNAASEEVESSNVFYEYGVGGGVDEVHWDTKVRRGGGGLRGVFGGEVMRCGIATEPACIDLHSVSRISLVYTSSADIWQSIIASIFVPDALSFLNSGILCVCFGQQLGGSRLGAK